MTKKGRKGLRKKDFYPCTRNSLSGYRNTLISDDGTPPSPRPLYAIVDFDATKSVRSMCTVKPEGKSLGHHGLEKKARF